MNFTINKNIAHEIIDGEAVIINFDNGNYYSLNKTGAEIWNFIEKKATLMEIVDDLAARYGGNKVEIEKSISLLLADLEKETLITTDRKNKGESFEPVQRTEIELKTEHRGFEMPALNKFTDMQELLLLDPIHEVDDSGWPNIKIDPFPYEK
jgi:hypothetical protein